MKGATEKKEALSAAKKISIRAPNEGSDMIDDVVGDMEFISIRAPNEGSDGKSAHFYNCI